MTELAVGDAFIAGDIDVDGDISMLFKAREHLQDKVPLRQKIRFLWDFARTSVAMNAKVIDQHYTRGDDFYLTYIDKKFRFYSQCIFKSPGDTLEMAAENKLETMFNALGLEEGMRILDIGGGWGGVTQYCGSRGIHVTTLTLTEDSAKYIKTLIQEHNLSGRVLLQDFLTYDPAECYDHVVMYGVIEHLPNYAAFARNAWKVLKPGGRLYMDGSAVIEKFHRSSFVKDHIWTGAHSYMTLPDVLAELLYHGFEVIEVKRETQDYGWTMKHWARRLEKHKEDIIAGWGAETYRMFRLYLWGGAHAFETNTLQAYHLVAEKTSSPGLRPSLYRRLMYFLGSLR